MQRFSIFQELDALIYETIGQIGYIKYICRLEKPGIVLVLIMKQCEDDTAFVPSNVLQTSLANYI